MMLLATALVVLVIFAIAAVRQSKRADREFTKTPAEDESTALRTVVRPSRYGPRS